MFCTTHLYIALRLLGEDADGDEDGAMMKARKWVLDRGGATTTPSWGEMWLSILRSSRTNVMPLPDGLSTNVIRVRKEIPKSNDKIGSSLRSALYAIPEAQIDWNRARYSCAKEDLYYPHPLIQE
ncbi:hypothetical protein ACLOJK_008115, partial [Asimina triloba]